MPTQKKYTAGSIIHTCGDILSGYDVIAKGNVALMVSGSQIDLAKGDVLGANDTIYGTHSFDYVALSDTIVLHYPLVEGQTLFDLLEATSELKNYFLTSTVKQICAIIDCYAFAQYDVNSLYLFVLEGYKDYVSQCKQHSVTAKSLPDYELLEPFHNEEDIEQWVVDYYEDFQKLSNAKLLAFSKELPNFCVGFVYKSNDDVHNITSACQLLSDYRNDISRFLLNENGTDLLDLYTSLYYKVLLKKADARNLPSIISTLMIHIESLSGIDSNLYKERINAHKTMLSDIESGAYATQSSALPTGDYTGSLDTILAYANCSNETSTAIKKLIDIYKNLEDKSSLDDASRKLRKDIAKRFYELYLAIFQASLRDSSIPTVIKMFLNFGYMDEELLDAESTSYLYSIADSYHGDNEHQIYTNYEWLTAIYNGKKEPSRNEFEMDYTAHVHDRKVRGEIDAKTEQALLRDQVQKVIFEIKNVFPLVNKMTFGRISAYCPILSEHSILKSLELSIVKPDEIRKALENITKLDYSAYYRETILNIEGKIPIREFIQLEVMPDIILMPNFGIRGVMWQEIEGRKRTTSARMFLPSFLGESLQQILIRLTGEYRWEMCRRVQGAHWNDLSEYSLTSEYFDYIQFYRRNRDLSQNNKDKIKVALQRAKNSYKEMFVRDYSDWIVHEANGSPRLNKISRSIVFKYCPFTKAIRDTLKQNPQYTIEIQRFTLNQQQKIHRIDMIAQKLHSVGLELPAALKKQLDFWKM